MLKGHTKIELKNEKTGEIQVVEKNNMVTNVINSQLSHLSNIVRPDYVNNEYFPVTENAMGGILLYQNQLTADKNNMLMPMDNPLIGYASTDVNSGTDTRRGSRNLTESTQLDNGFKYVWDFATSQANGEISAIALTHKNTGKGPKDLDNYDLGGMCINNFDISLKRHPDMDFLQYALSYDFDTNILVCVKTLSSTQIQVTKIKLYIGQPLGVNDSILSYKIIFSQTIQLSQDINKGTIWFDGKDGYYYGLYSAQYSSKSVNIVRINSSNYELDTAYTDTFSVPFYIAICKNDAGAVGGIDGGYGTTIVDGDIYSFSYDNVFKFNTITKNVQTFTIEDIDGKSDAYDVNKSGFGVTYINGYFLNYGYIITKDFKRYIRKNAHYGFFYDYGATNRNTMRPFLRPDGTGISIESISPSSDPNRVLIVVGNLRNYLATINNLDTPVTKTSEQSMKITYTLTEES